MKGSLGRKNADSVSSVGSMILFLLFASCALILIAVGASTYSRISGIYDDTFSTSAAERYVTNKIRSAESTSLSEDGRTLYVYGSGSVCAISSGYDGITEINGGIGDELDLKMGDVIFPGAAMMIELNEDGLYEIKVLSGGKMTDIFCRNKG